MKAVLYLFIAALLCSGGCSKKNPTAKSEAGEDESSSSESLPELTKDEPGLQSNPESTAITRQSDGLWHEAVSGKIFSGKVDYEQDETRFEEKFKKGVRISVRAWDKEDNPVELHAWNEDGSPRY